MSVVGDHGRSRPESRADSSPGPGSDPGSGPEPGPDPGGDEAAFREYVSARRGALYGMALVLTGNRADAEDLVQAALAKTYLSWARIHKTHDRAALDNYVRRTMVNTHISWWRQRKLEEYPTDELPDQAIADHAGDSDLADSVRRALDRLPQRMRLAVMLRYFEDMTEPEIAATLGISLGTVKSTVSRAVAKLRIDADLGPGDGLLRAGNHSWHYQGECPKAARRCPVRSTMMDVPLTITSLMRYGSTVFGDREVVTATDNGSRRRDYAQTGRRAARLANALRRLGVDADQRVGTYMWNNAEHLEAYLAVPSMGAVLHTLNLRLDPAETGYVANHADDYAVIVDGCLLEKFAQVLPHAPGIRHVIISGPERADLPGVAVHSYEDLLAAEDDTFGWPRIDELSAAAMCYTSGTTGNPKGVVYSHRSAYLHALGPCLGNAFGLSEQDKVLPVVPMFHANAWGLPYASVLAGADLVMPDRYMQPAALVKLIGDEQVTVAGGVPTIWIGILAHLREHGGDLSSVRLCVCGGSAVPHSLMAAFEKEFGVNILQAWGMTETSPLGSIAKPPRGVSDDEAWKYRATAGRLFCTIEGRLVGDDGVLPSDGEAVGELEVRGPWVTGSYYQDDDPGKFHDGWLRTGDVGTLDQRGYIRLTDRAKDVIKSGGEWISSMDLENILMSHPDVAEAAVIGVEDEKWGERPLAAVVLLPGATVSAAALREFLSGHIQRWQLPERWCFIAEVPKTSVGKFSKRQMREAYQRGDYEIIEAR